LSPTYIGEKLNPRGELVSYIGEKLTPRGELVSYLGEKLTPTGANLTPTQGRS
jgi:hypothetical protein